MRSAGPQFSRTGDRCAPKREGPRRSAVTGYGLRVAGYAVSQFATESASSARLADEDGQAGDVARRLLTRTDKLVSEIATATGFWDQSHFIKAFRAERGQTPTEYRREHWNRG